MACLSSPHRFVGDLKITNRSRQGERPRRGSKDRAKMAICPLENVGLCDPYVAKGDSIQLD